MQQKNQNSLRFERKKNQDESQDQKGGFDDKKTTDKGDDP